MASNSFRCHLCHVDLDESTIKQHISEFHLNRRPYDGSTCNEKGNSYKTVTEKAMGDHIAISHSSTNSGYLVIKDQCKEKELKAAIEERRRVSTLQLSSVDTTVAWDQHSTVNRAADTDENIRVTLDSLFGAQTEAGNISDEMEEETPESEIEIIEFDNDDEETEVKQERGQPSHDVVLEVVRPELGQSNNVSVSQLWANVGQTYVVNGEKRHKCQQCQYATNRKDHLTRHIRNHTGEKPYKCKKCNYATSQSSNLISHERTHTGERRFKCKKCNYAAGQHSDLIKHERIHSGEKPYKCRFCEFATAHHSSFITHLRIHTREKPYKCCFCEFASSYNPGLKKHVQTHHKDSLKVQQR